MKTCYVLVGVPGSGKTTWATEFMAELAGTPISRYYISTDNVVEEYAKENGLSYKKAWMTIKDDLEKSLLAQVEEVLFKLPNVVVWDQTNLSRTKRARIRSLLGDNYRYIYVIFETTKERMLATNEHRKLTDRDLPEEVLEHMYVLYNLEPVTKEEGMSIPDGMVSHLWSIGNGMYIYD